jgi:CheY-like chemotaxis protein
MNILSWIKKKQDADDPSATGAYPKPEEAHHHPVRCEILLVEDDPAQLEFTTGLLRMQGAIVTQARNIAEALEAIASPVRFQLAFVDLNLANSSGVEVVRRIKESKRGTHPVLVSADFDKIQQCLPWGYVGVLAKPFTVGAIRDVLRSHRLPTTE